MASRSLGYIPDPPDRRDLDLASLSLASSALPAECSLMQHVPAILDQESTSSCVAQAFAQAIVVAERSRGVTLELPSRLAIYYNARRQAGLLVLDQGTYLRAAATGLQKLGAPGESVWPFSTGMVRVNRRPSFDAYMRGFARRGGAYLRVTEYGDQRVLAVKAAIVAGTPVTFGTQVGMSFLRASGETMIGPPLDEPIAGGHAMVIVGYREMPGAGTVFEVVNSWGTAWRANGTWLLTAEYLRWPGTQDLWCVHGWEAVRG